MLNFCMPVIFKPFMETKEKKRLKFVFSISAKLVVGNLGCFRA
jgi:hypothetical protein